jgi:uncharacterized protein
MKDLSRLDGFLCSDRVPENAMRLDELDGFIAALICGPDLVPPSEWMPVLWGGEGPVWKSIEEAQDILGLIMRLWNADAHAINTGSDYEPILGFRRNELGLEVSVADGWCYGFATGIRLRSDLWFKSRSEKVLKLLMPVGVFLAGHRDEKIAELINDPETVEELLDSIPEMVYGLRRYWLDQESPRSRAKGSRSKSSGRRPSKPDRRSNKPPRGSRKHPRRTKTPK